MTQPPQDPAPISGPWQPRTTVYQDARAADAAILAILHAGPGYPSLCQAGRFGTPLWHAIYVPCKWCGDSDCDCAWQVADAYAAFADHRSIPHPVRLTPTVAVGGVQ